MVTKVGILVYNLVQYCSQNLEPQKQSLIDTFVLLSKSLSIKHSNSAGGA